LAGVAAARWAAPSGTQAAAQSHCFYAYSSHCSSSPGTASQHPALVTTRCSTRSSAGPYRPWLASALASGIRLLKTRTNRLCAVARRRRASLAVGSGAICGCGGPSWRQPRRRGRQVCVWRLG
jgi:hypothetical protein